MKSTGLGHWISVAAQPLRRARYRQPLNWALTSLVKGVISATGVRSELVIKHLHRVGNVRSRLPNGRVLQLWSRADDWVSNQVFWRGWTGYEPETAALFFRLASQARVTFDVGAYVGFYSLLAAHANPNGRVFAFEPLPAAFERLERNMARNGLDNVACIRAAAGASEGTLPFYHQDQGSLPCSSSLSLDFMRGTPNLMKTAVPVLRLESFARSHGLASADLIKLDTESTEPDVLRGAAGLLRDAQPFIICEVLAGRGAEAALTEILRPLGYRFYHLTPEGPEERADVRGHPTWLNYLYDTGARGPEGAALGPGTITRRRRSLCGTGLRLSPRTRLDAPGASASRGRSRRQPGRPPSSPPGSVS